MTPLPALTTVTLWDILSDRLDDDTVNRLVWHYLGYRYQADSNQWLTDQVDPTWVEKYPTPPNFIDSRPATVQLTRSIPPANKQLLKEYLGFQGYTVDQLMPRLTRRATMVNWLLNVMQQQGLLEESDSQT